MSRKRSNLETVEGVSIWRRADAGPRVRWRVTYRDPRTGKRKTETVSSDRDLTLEYARDVRARMVRSRKGLTDVVRDRWAEQDLITIPTHLQEWAKSMRDAGKDAKHVRQFHDYARAVLLGNEAERRELAEDKRRKRGQRRTHEPVALAPLGVKRISHVVASKVQGQIGKVKAQRSAATANRYLDALTAFLNWGLRDHRWERNACKHLPRFSADEDRRRVRRAIEVEDFRRLIEVTDRPDAPKAGGMSGPERSRMYRFTVASGFRAKEVRGARLQDLASSPTPGIWTRASISRKNKKRIFVPLPQNLVGELLVAGWGKKPEDKLFDCPSDMARMLRVDLERAGIPYKTATGTFDFHAVRHTTATLLISAGVTDIKAIQGHMRHSRSSLTLDTYGHLLESGKDKTAKALPDFSGAQRAGQRSTGNVLPSTSAKRPIGGSDNLENPRKSEWSDGESNPDLLNAIQSANSRGNSRQPIEEITTCASSASASANGRAAPAVAQGDLSHTTRAAKLLRAEGRTPSVKAAFRKTRELTQPARGGKGAG